MKEQFNQGSNNAQQKNTYNHNSDKISSHHSQNIKAVINTQSSMDQSVSPNFADRIKMKQIDSIDPSLNHLVNSGIEENLMSDNIRDQGSMNMINRSGSALTFVADPSRL